MEPRLSCRDFVEFLADYLSGELPREQLRAFHVHMAQCPSCVSYAKTYLEAVRLGKLALREDDPVPSAVPQDLIRAILAVRGTP